MTTTTVRTFEMGRATREAYADALVALGDEFPNLYVLDADLSKSTKSGSFGKKYPDRYQNVGIAEANMVSIASGLASVGYVPFCGSFACFLLCKGYDQIRACVTYPGNNVKFLGSHGGISIGEDGPSQMGIEDVALATSLPGMVVAVPADDVSMEGLVRSALQHPGPVYLRAGRPAFPRVHAGRRDFQLGRAIVLEEGRDVAILANGLMVAEALQARDLLAASGIDVMVIDCHTVKPLDPEAIRRAVSTGAIVTAEEHQVWGGLGAEVAQAVVRTRPVPGEHVAIQDTYAESGTPRQLLERYGLTHLHVAEAVRRVLMRKC